MPLAPLLAWKGGEGKAGACPVRWGAQGSVSRRKSTWSFWVGFAFVPPHMTLGEFSLWPINKSSISTAMALPLFSCIRIPVQDSMEQGEGSG